MLRSKVVVASQNNSALKTSGGHLGSASAQSSCLTSLLYRTASYVGLIGRVVFPPPFFFFFSFLAGISGIGSFSKLFQTTKTINLFVPEKNMGDQTLLVGLVRKSSVFLSSPRG